MNITDENTRDTTRPCASCEGLGEVRSPRMSPEAICDLEPCSDCQGRGEVPVARGTSPCGDGYLAAPALELVATT